MHSTAHLLVQHVSAQRVWYCGKSYEWNRKTVKLYMTVGGDQQYIISTHAEGTIIVVKVNVVI